MVIQCSVWLMSMELSWKELMTQLPHLPDEAKVNQQKQRLEPICPDRDGAVRATVPGKQARYRVELDPAGPLKSSCTCPDFERRQRARGSVCKHIMAVAHNVRTVAGPSGLRHSTQPARPGAGRPATMSLVRPYQDGRLTPPPLVEDLPELDPVHLLGTTRDRKRQLKEHHRLLVTGAFTCSGSTNVAMDIREAVVRFRLLTQEEYAKVALLWCAVREPGEENKTLLRELAVTLGRSQLSAVEKWLRDN